MKEFRVTVCEEQSADTKFTFYSKEELLTFWKVALKSLLVAGETYKLSVPKAKRSPTMVEQKKSFILYTEQRETMKALSNEDAGRLIKAIYDYAADGTLPEFNDFLKVVFIPIRQQMDRNNERYNVFVEKQKQYR